jgi:sugar phosphate isomerase/epimerase
MRFRHRDGTIVHLAYCTNVHPAETLTGVLAQLDRYAVPVRAALGTGTLGLGLWLARGAATELLADPAAIPALRRALDDRGLEVVTLNGFPYRGFHDPVVKYAVYQPDWTTGERLRYTLDLARILAGLLPDGAEYGSISTLPLAWRTPWDEQRQAAAAARLDDLTRALREQAERTGRPVRVAVEPEPGCVIETVEQAAAQLPASSREWLGLCLDTCHLAVAFEEPGTALDQLRAAGIAVYKMQASCALEAAQPAQPATARRLSGFAEPRFLHQVRTVTEDGRRGVDDLGDALAGGLDSRGRWRVHAHVPVHAPAEAPLQATQAVLASALTALLGGERALTSHVEVETYTWQVLPGRARPGSDAELTAGIAAELAWTRDRMLDLGLREVAA